MEKLRRTLKELLQQEELKYIVGYKPGTYGWRVSPAFIRTADEADEAIFSPLCVNNLATYAVLEQRLPLPEQKKEQGKKIGIVVKGCDSRAVTLLIQENAIQREDVTLIGVPCNGVIDPQKMQAKFGDVLEAVSIKADGETYVVSLNGSMTEVPKSELMADACAHCRYPTPVLYDVLLGDPIPALASPGYDTVANVETLPSEERWAYWRQQFERCVRCYACRNVCPVCNCEECMADTFEPSWIRRSVNVSENTAYHTMRAFHMAGRCVSCGMCEKACPVDIPLTTLYQKVEKDVLELFDYTSGIDHEAEPLLSVFDVNDPDEGIL